MNLDIDRTKQTYLKNTNTTQTAKSIAFRGPLDSVLTQTLMAINTNPMVNAATVDVGFMVIPRTGIDTKKRNKFAGFETFFRELTGTIIVCLSGGAVGMGIAAIHNKIQDKEINISPKIWATNDAFDTLKSFWIKSDKNVDNYTEQVLSNISGIDGKNISEWKNIDWNKVEWFDRNSWSKIKWKDKKWSNVVDSTKDRNGIIKALSNLIKDKNVDKHDVKKVSEILEYRITNALRTGESIDLTSGKSLKLSTSLKHLIRDTHDLGKNIFDTTINLERAEAKLKSINKFKSIGAVAIVATLGLVNQYINRCITKKRTGKDDFVGEQNYATTSASDTNKDNKKTNKARFAALKALASAGILALSLKVMKVNSFKEFIKKIELKSAFTSGNAIKTIFTATLIGRFVAARRESELRESCTRDYLAFLNWLVLGGFVLKGVAQLLFDRKMEYLFNIREDGSKGIKKWLNNISLKSHAEIAAKGTEFARKNMWKVNLAHGASLLYSGLALGCAIPLLNIFVSYRNKKQNNQIKKPINSKATTFTGTNVFTSKVFETFYDKQKIGV